MKMALNGICWAIQSTPTAKGPNEASAQPAAVRQCAANHLSARHSTTLLTPNPSIARLTTSDPKCDQLPTAKIRMIAIWSAMTAAEAKATEAYSATAAAAPPLVMSKRSAGPSVDVASASADLSDAGPRGRASGVSLAAWCASLATASSTPVKRPFGTAVATPPSKGGSACAIGPPDSFQSHAHTGPRLRARQAGHSGLTKGRQDWGQV